MRKLMILLVMFCLNIAVVSAANEQKGNSTPNVEKVQVTPSNDKNPVIGEIKMADGQTYQVHKGPRGGLYIWWRYTKGAKKGQIGKRNLNKTEKERVVFTKK